MHPGAEIPCWNSAPFIRHTSKIHTAPIDGKAFGRSQLGGLDWTTDERTLEQVVVSLSD